MPRRQVRLTSVHAPPPRPAGRHLLQLALYGALFAGGALALGWYNINASPAPARATSTWPPRRRFPRDRPLSRLGLGLGITFVASLVYVAAWEIGQALSGADFAAAYSRAMIEQQRVAGVSGEALARYTAEMADFRRSYANPL